MNRNSGLVPQILDVLPPHSSLLYHLLRPITARLISVRNPTRTNALLLRREPLQRIPQVHQRSVGSPNMVDLTLAPRVIWIVDFRLRKELCLVEVMGGRFECIGNVKEALGVGVRISEGIEFSSQ
jgi:hypothetical protein